MIICEMRNSVKNMLDSIFFTQLFVSERKQIALYGRRKIAFANFSSLLRDKIAQKRGLV